MLEGPLQEELVSAMLRGSLPSGSGLRGAEQLGALETELRSRLTAVREAVQGGRPVRGEAGELAAALVRWADGNPERRSMLERWAGAVPPSTTAEAGHTNVLSGSARVAGPMVQARDVHGGIHVHQPEPRPPVAPPPRQLPPVSARFTGRTAELDALDRLRTAHPRGTPQLIVVSGPAGVGKTALSCAWLSGHSGEFPDGQLYADLGGGALSADPHAGQVLDRFLRALGAASVPAETAERVSLWRTLTAGRQLAVLLDNAMTAAQVRSLLPGGPETLVMVTSRRRLTGLVVDGAAAHRLGALTETAALDLLRRGGGPHVCRDAAAARRVVQLCAGLPLAVCLAAAQLAARPMRPVAAVAAVLAGGRGPLDALRLEGEATLRMALDESYDMLPEEAARTYRCLGLLPVSRFDSTLVAAARGITVDAGDRELEVLCEMNLAEETGPGTYRFHDLVRMHAEQRGQAGETESARSTFTRRFVDWCLHTATAAEELLSPSHRTLSRRYVHRPAVPLPFASTESALSWLDTHRDTLMGAVRHSDRCGWDDSVWQLVDAMWPLFLRLRPSELWIEAHSTGLAAARRTGDRAAVGRMLTSGGNGLRDARRLEEAADWYVLALEHAEADGDIRQQAQALQGLGNCHLAAGRTQEAAVCFDRALRLRESTGYPRGAALSRLCLGETALAAGDPAGALSHLSRARSELAAAGDIYDAARASAFLGQARAQAGDRRGGVRELRQALADFELTGSGHWQARTLEMLGRVAQDYEDAEQAARCYAESLALYRPLNPSAAARVENRLRALTPGAE
ncbi:tetratricopeptide repeat protein [Streptomyces sp. ACA25]|uniref:tetratricopeptide repeat protein n=1 Tax=Streptomyces sp. ACA25 TaxID=3022596 RepID=UPI00230813F1|nr:tetratricopeptide repeat protein [Streptomyces sp. ACA25]MDB1089814.1 tetratricopeptide repeat protein [Streptomyces sp. ACA25]